MSYLVGVENLTIAVCIVIAVVAIAATAAWLHFPKNDSPARTNDFIELPVVDAAGDSRCAGNYLARPAHKETAAQEAAVG